MVAQRYYLEDAAERNNGATRRYPLESFPAIVGRSGDCQIVLAISRISRQHAQFELRGGALILEDLGSTNGTFVNHQRIAAECTLQTGDVIHFADHEFRIIFEKPESEPADFGKTMVGINTLPGYFPTQGKQFEELLDQELVRGYGQLITNADGSPYAIEMLGRGNHPELDQSPAVMFALAEFYGEQVRLSRLLREACFRSAAEQSLRCPLFFNSHPKECLDLDHLLTHLREQRELYPDLRLVFEVHESAITDLAAMADFRKNLRLMDIELAYDDFGAGQARLLELAEVPPDYLKYDIGLIKDLEGPSSPRYHLLATMTQLAHDLGTHTLAEGIETHDCAQQCRDLGIQLFQGFLFGRPADLHSFAADDLDSSRTPTLGN